MLAVCEEYKVDSEEVAKDLITMRAMVLSPRLQEGIKIIMTAAEESGVASHCG